MVKEKHDRKKGVSHTQDTKVVAVKHPQNNTFKHKEGANKTKQRTVSNSLSKQVIDSLHCLKSCCCCSQLSVVNNVKAGSGQLVNLAGVLAR